MTTTSKRSAPALTIDLIDRDYLEIVATGDFCAAFRDVLSDRLARLVSGGPIRLRIDFGEVLRVDPIVADLFAGAAVALARRGGALDIVEANPVVASAFGASFIFGDGCARRTPAPLPLDVAPRLERLRIDPALPPEWPWSERLAGNGDGVLGNRSHGWQSQNRER